MLPKNMEAKLNEQIKNELSSAYVYLAMAAKCEADNFEGIAHWLELQAKEELAHAMRFYRFVLDRGGKVTFHSLPEPGSDFGSLEAIFEEVLRHEEKITRTIHELYALAEQEKDYASYPFLQEFIVEQIEEEKTAAQVLATVRMAGGDPKAIFLLDRELAKRPGE